MGGGNSKATPVQSDVPKIVSYVAPEDIGGDDDIYGVCARRGAVKKATRGQMEIELAVDNSKKAKATMTIKITKASAIETSTKDAAGNPMAKTYVKVEITPPIDGCAAQKTDVVDGLAPKYNSEFKFVIPKKSIDLQSHRVVIAVRNNKPDGRIEKVGSFSFSLDEVYEPVHYTGDMITGWFKILDDARGLISHIQHVVRKKRSKDGGKKAARSASSASAGEASFSIGDRVWVTGVGAGKVAFVGDHHVKKSARVGIILDTAGGKNNGTVGGHEYFQCADKHGCLTVPSKVELETAETAPTADTKDGVYDDTEGFQGVVALPTPAPKTDKKSKKVKQADFTYKKVLGRGSFGKVMLAEKDGNVFAIKVLKKTNVVDDDDVTGTMIEKRTLELSEGCPFLTKLHATFQTDENLFYVMEFVNGGDLMYWIMKKRCFTLAESRFYCAEILLGLFFLHDHGVLYRDLKLDNVMMCGDGHVKLADFGLAKENIFGQAQTTTFCGTPSYLAPEILAEAPYGSSVDLWSLGVLAHEFICGESPFESMDDDELFEQIQKKKITVPRCPDKDAKQFVLGLLQRDPTKRLGCGAQGQKQIKKHPFFNTINWTKLGKLQIAPPFVPPIKNPKAAEMFDSDFTGERVQNTPQDGFKLMQLDADEFKGFSFVNATGAFGNAKMARKASMKVKNVNKFDLSAQKWYRPDLGRAEVQSSLTGKPNGTFCVRESKTKPGCFALTCSVPAGGPSPTYTGLVTPYPDGKGDVKYALISKARFDSMPDLVDFYKLNPIPYGDSTVVLTKAL